MSITYFDALEVRSPEHREQRLLAQLPQVVSQAKEASGWRKVLEGVDSAAITTREALEQLPVTRKASLVALQQSDMPFGGLNVAHLSAMRRGFMSPGPIFEAQGIGADWWRCARALHALGLGRGDVLQNCFSYHFTPGAFLVEEGALHLGAVVIPAGPGNTEMQIKTMEAFRASAYAGTPSFLLHILEHINACGLELPSFKRAILSAEALPESLRKRLLSLGLERALQFYGTADIGVIAYETVDDSGNANPGMILEEDLLLELLRPGTDEPALVGEIGEIVVTSFNTQFPLIRFATGDLSRILPGLSPCGRTNTRIQGWLGRVDQLTKVRGMFIHPQHVQEIIRRHPFIQRARLVVFKQRGNDEMILQCEVHDEILAHAEQESVLRSIRIVTQLRGSVGWNSLNTLPQDGLLIEDKRTLE